MPSPLQVPWEKIREAVEKGTSQADVSKLFNISLATIRMRSQRENWNTPRRLSNRLSKVAGSQGDKVIANAIRAGELYEAEAAQKSTDSSQELDFDQATKLYRTKSVLKMAKLLDGSVIAPPRTWKDYDIADKIMRRLLGIDDQEGKSNTIVQLQVVNDRLKTSLQDDIIEGDIVEESVQNLSSESTEQSELVGSQPETAEIAL